MPKQSGSPGLTKQNSQEMQNSTLVSYATENLPPIETTTTASSTTKGTVLLQTATAIARNEDGSKSTTVKIVFDGGRLRSNVTDSLKSELGLKSRKTEILHLNTFGERKFRKKKCDAVTLLFDDPNDYVSKISALSFPTICSPLPSRVDVSSFPHSNGLQLVDC